MWVDVIKKLVDTVSVNVECYFSILSLLETQLE